MPSSTPLTCLPRWLRADEAAAAIGLSTSTLAKLRVYGGGPAYSRLGRAIVYAPDDLAAWVAARRRTSTSDMGAA